MFQAGLLRYAEKYRACIPTNSNKISSQNAEARISKKELLQ